MMEIKTEKEIWEDSIDIWSYKEHGDVCFDGETYKKWVAVDDLKKWILKNGKICQSSQIGLEKTFIMIDGENLLEELKGENIK